MQSLPTGVAAMLTANDQTPIAKVDYYDTTFGVPSRGVNYEEWTYAPGVSLYTGHDGRLNNTPDRGSILAGNGFCEASGLLVPNVMALWRHNGLPGTDPSQGFATRWSGYFRMPPSGNPEFEGEHRTWYLSANSAAILYVGPVGITPYDLTSSHKMEDSAWAATPTEDNRDIIEVSGVYTQNTWYSFSLEHDRYAGEGIYGKILLAYKDSDPSGVYST